MIWENQILNTLGILQRTRFTWKKNPIKILRERFPVAGLRLEIFGEDLALFIKLKNRLGRKFQVGEFQKYHTFIVLLNQNDFQWQLDTIWEVLFSREPGEGCYELLETLLYVEEVVEVN